MFYLESVRVNSHAIESSNDNVPTEVDNYCQFRATHSRQCHNLPLHIAIQIPPVAQRDHPVFSIPRVACGLARRNPQRAPLTHVYQNQCNAQDLAFSFAFVPIRLRLTEKTISPFVLPL